MAAAADECAGDADEGEEVLGPSLVTAVQSAAAGKRTQGAFDHPAVPTEAAGGPPSAGSGGKARWATGETHAAGDPQRAGVLAAGWLRVVVGRMTCRRGRPCTTTGGAGSKKACGSGC